MGIGEGCRDCEEVVGGCREGFRGEEVGIRMVIVKNSRGLVTKYIWSCARGPYIWEMLKGSTCEGF